MERIHLNLINARLQLIQFKVMHRLHYSKEKINKIYPNVSDICDRCNLSKGTLGHTFWFCPKIVPFWQDIFTWYWLSLWWWEIEPDALIALLGCSEQQTLMFDIVAKTIILSLCFSRYFGELVSGIHLERLHSNTHGFHEKFESTWGPIIRHINSPTCQLKSLQCDT